MNRNTFLLILLVFLVFASCTKKSSSPTSGNNGNPTTNPYYFKFSFNGTAYNFSDTVKQYASLYPNETGGYQDAVFATFPNIGLKFNWPAGDTVKESDILGLKGKTLYFTDTAPNPELIVNTGYAITQYWDSYDTATHGYSVQISNITYLRRDTTIGIPLRTYVITGTCSGLLYQGSTHSAVTGGQFNFVISRMDL